MPDITQFTDYDSGNASLPKLYLDAMQDPGTKVILDFRDPYSYAEGVIPAGTLAAGRLFRNLVDDSMSITLNGTSSPASQGIGSTGFKLDTVNTNVSLGAGANFGAGATDFSISFWGKPTTTVLTSGQTGSVVANETSTAAANCQYLFQCRGDDPSLYNVQVAGAYIVGFSWAYDEVAHWLFNVKVAGGNITVYLYKNGALIRTSNSYAGALPTPASTPVLGQAPALGGWRGQIGRVLITDHTISGAVNAATLAAAEYAAMTGRFS